MLQLEAQAILAGRPQPVVGVISGRLLRAEVQLDRQLQVMHALVIAQQQIQLAQGLPSLAYRQAGGQ